MDGASRIGLGTAQFGLEYGITNTAGKVCEAVRLSSELFCAAAGTETRASTAAVAMKIVLARMMPPPLLNPDRYMGVDSRSI